MQVTKIRATLHADKQVLANKMNCTRKVHGPTQTRVGRKKTLPSMAQLTVRDHCRK